MSTIPTLCFVDSMVIFSLSIQVSTRMSLLPSCNQIAQTVPTGCLRSCLTALGTPFLLVCRVPVTVMPTLGRYPNLLLHSTYALTPQGCGLPLRYCRKETQPLKEITNSSIAMCLSGSVCCFKCCAEVIYEGLDLPFLSSAVWVTNVQGSKDLKEAIPGKDRPEERQVSGVVC